MENLPEDKGVLGGPTQVLPLGQGTGIYKAVSSIMKKIVAIGKGQENREMKFMFRGIDDVYNSIHPLMAEHGVFTTTTTMSAQYQLRDKGGGKYLVWCKLDLLFRMFAEDGSYVEDRIIGEAMDHGSDKATNKALAIAHKYYFLQKFCIPTADLKDTDSESPSINGPPQEGKARHVSPAKPKPQPQAPAKPGTTPRQPSPPPADPKPEQAPIRNTEEKAQGALSDEFDRLVQKRRELEDPEIAEAFFKLSQERALNAPAKEIEALTVNECRSLWKFYSAVRSEQAEALQVFVDIVAEISTTKRIGPPPADAATPPPPAPAGDLPQKPKDPGDRLTPETVDLLEEKIKFLAQHGIEDTQQFRLSLRHRATGKGPEKLITEADALVMINIITDYWSQDTRKATAAKEFIDGARKDSGQAPLASAPPAPEGKRRAYRLGGKGGK